MFIASKMVLLGARRVLYPSLTAYTEYCFSIYVYILTFKVYLLYNVHTLTLRCGGYVRKKSDPPWKGSPQSKYFEIFGPPVPI